MNRLTVILFGLLLLLPACESVPYPLVILTIDVTGGKCALGNTERGNPDGTTHTFAQVSCNGYLQTSKGQGYNWKFAGEQDVTPTGFWNSPFGQNPFQAVNKVADAARLELISYDEGKTSGNVIKSKLAAATGMDVIVYTTSVNFLPH